MWLKEEEENLTPQIKLKFRSTEEVNFVSQYSSYFSRLKELGEEGPAHGLFFSVFLSSPGKMFCTDHFDFYGMRQ